MGEGDARAVSAHLPGSVLQATGIRLAIATYLCCVTQARALRRAAAKAAKARRGARDPRGVGKPANAAPSKASRTSEWCEVRESIPSPFSRFTGPSRGRSDNVLRKPQAGGKPCTTLANDKHR
jgi:hypothetical protein